MASLSNNKPAPGYKYCLEKFGLFKYDAKCLNWEYGLAEFQSFGPRADAPKLLYAGPMGLFRRNIEQIEYIFDRICWMHKRVFDVDIICLRAFLEKTTDENRKVIKDEDDPDFQFIDFFEDIFEDNNPKLTLVDHFMHLATHNSYDEAYKCFYEPQQLNVSVVIKVKDGTIIDITDKVRLKVISFKEMIASGKPLYREA